MKKKIVFGVIIFIFVLQVQTVFAVPGDRHEIAFLLAFENSDLMGMERALNERTSQTNLEALLLTVVNSLSEMGSGGMNRNLSTGITALQLLFNCRINVNDRAEYYYIGNSGRFLSMANDGSMGETPLIYGIAYGLNVQAVRLLLEAGANMYSHNPNLDHGLFPSRDENIAIARVMIENGYNVNRVFTSRDNETQLHRAARNGNIGIVRLLIESGAMINREDSNRKTAAQVAYEARHIDIYNYLKQNGAIWTAPSQVATVPSNQGTSHNNSQNFTPPPSPNTSSSSNTNTPPRNVGREIAEAFSSPLQNGTYSLVNSRSTLRLTAIARSGMFTYNINGQTGTGTYSIDGNRMTIQMRGYTLLYTVDSQTQFSGNGETWVRTGY